VILSGTVFYLATRQLSPGKTAADERLDYGRPPTRRSFTNLGVLVYFPRSTWGSRLGGPQGPPSEGFSFSGGLDTVTFLHGPSAATVIALSFV